MELNDIKLIVYFILAFIFGPYIAFHFSFIGDFYSLSKTYPLFDEITEEWLLVLSIFLFWLGLFFILSFWNALQKFINKPPKLEWWQTGVLYQIYVKSFNDSNGDGIGDLRGIIEKLDYLKSIGVESIWLTPFYPSGGFDGGYDVTSFVDIDPLYGNLKDFDDLVEQIHLRDMRILIDFIPNHTSDQHEWFKESCKSSDASNPYRDYYVWYSSENSVEPPNNWLSVFGGSAWHYNENRKAWYLHQFLKQQPDLNVRSPVVQNELKKVIKFWLETKKVDGMRIDALKHLFESETFENEPVKFISQDGLDYNNLKHIHTTNQPETFQLLNEWRSLCDDISKRTKSVKAIIVEATYDHVKELQPYYKFKSNKMAHFPFNFQMCSLRDEKKFNPKELKNLIQDYVKILPKKSWPNWQLGNHDTPRIASRIGNQYINLANALNLLLGGTPIVYYGEEIGMEDLPTMHLKYEDCRDEFGKRHGPANYLTYTRDFQRTPMQWLPEYMSSAKSWLPIHPNYKIKNVQNQLNEMNSHLNVFIDLVKLRKNASTLQWGALNFVKVEEKIFSFTRTAYDFPTYLIVMNFSEENINTNLLVSTDIAPRAYVALYIPGKSSDETHAYEKGEPVLTKNVSLKAYDCLILTWHSTN